MSHQSDNNEYDLYLLNLTKCFYVCSNKTILVSNYYRNELQFTLLQTIYSRNIGDSNGGKDKLL